MTQSKKSRSFPKSFKFLVHKTIADQIKDFERVASKSELRSLRTQVRKCRSDPLGGGGRLREVRGVPVFKVHVGGPSGFRMIYLVQRHIAAVIPLLVSCDRKSRFDYTKYDWLSLAYELKHAFESCSDDFVDWDPDHQD